jgi:hypothetical protein
MQLISALSNSSCVFKYRTISPTNSSKSGPGGLRLVSTTRVVLIEPFFATTTAIRCELICRLWIIASLLLSAKHTRGKWQRRGVVKSGEFQTETLPVLIVNSIPLAQSRESGDAPIASDGLSEVRRFRVTLFFKLRNPNRAVRRANVHWIIQSPIEIITVDSAPVPR